MSKQVLYIADSMYPEYIGGGELNDYELCEILKKNFKVVKHLSANLSLQVLKKHKDSFLLISNFLGLKPDVCQEIITNRAYVIYEHDHKYLKSRNPAFYPDYMAPKEELVNKNLYLNAKAVFCQTKFHKSIIERNTNLKNVISVGGNLWSEESLKLLENMASKEKKDKFSIMETPNWHKNTADAVKYCVAKKYQYDLIKSSSYLTFLQNLGNNKNFIFLPKTPETLSRIVVEARMCGMNVVVNKNVGAKYEDWFNLKGVELINLMRHKKTEIIKTVSEVINEN
jgi:hypothetical protein